MHKAHYLSHTSILFYKYNVLKLDDIYRYCCNTFMFKFSKKSLPPVCNNFILLKEPDIMIHYNLRKPNTYDVPNCRTTLRNKCFRIRGPKYWLTIPNIIKESSSIFIFKKALRKYLIQNYT